MSEDSRGSLPEVRPISAPMDVPVFNVVIYVSETAGKVTAKVANLPDIAFTASSEPHALKQAITTVKQQLSTWHASGEAIPWVDPLPNLESNEQQRLVPVHL